MLAGYKTYIACFLAIIPHIAGVLTGDETVMAAMQAVMPYLVAMAFRHGISTGA